MIVDSNEGLLRLYLTTIGDAFRHLASRARALFGAVARRLGLPLLSLGGSDDIYSLSRGLFGAAMALILARLMRSRDLGDASSRRNVPLQQPLRDACVPQRHPDPPAKVLGSSTAAPLRATRP